jgi:ankyrin repeat protein
VIVMHKFQVAEKVSGSKRKFTFMTNYRASFLFVLMTLVSYSTGCFAAQESTVPAEQLANIVDEYGAKFPSLDLAEKKQYRNRIHDLFESGADPDEYVRNKKITPLALSIAPVIDLDLLKELLQYSDEINKSHWGNETLLEKVIFKKNLDAIKLLLDMGADIDGYSCCRPEMKSSPLSTAVLLGHFEIARYLISRGADINAKNGKKSILTSSILKKEWDFAKMLVEKGADLSDSNYLCTALSQNASIDFIALLITHGASLEQKDYIGRNAKQCAESLKRDDAIKLFEQKQN